MMLFGNFIYEMSSWTRAIVIPLSIVHAMNPRRPVPAGFNLKELCVVGGLPPTTTWNSRPIATVSPGAMSFLRLDKVLKLWEKYGSKSLRQRAIRKAEAVDAGAHPAHRRCGRDLSADDVRHHGAGSAGLSRPISRSAWKPNVSSTA